MGLDLLDGVRAKGLMSRDPNGGERSTLCSPPSSEGPKPVVTPRPERLVNRLKSITLDDASAPRLVIVRQPRGPDNSKVTCSL